MIEKKIFAGVKIYSSSDLTKDWFCYYYNRGKRVKKYEGINKYRTVDARMAAAKKLQKKLEEKLKGLPSDLELALFEQLKKNAVSYRRKTKESYFSKLRLFSKFLNGREITSDLVEEYLYLIKSTRAAVTYNKYIDLFKKLFREVGISYMIDGHMRVKENSTPARYFQRHQKKQIISYLEVNDPELLLFVKFMYYTFARPNELRQMRISDILFDENKLLFRGSISKNGKTEYVSIPRYLKKDISHLITLRPDSYIFHHKDNRNYSKNVMSNRHRAALRKLGYGAEYKLYSWKHTGVVAAAMSGIPMKELQIQLRHHSLDMVDKYLRQLGVSDLKNLATNMPEI